MLPIKPNNPFWNWRFRDTWQNLIVVVAKPWRDFVMSRGLNAEADIIWSIWCLVHFVHSLHNAMNSEKASVTRGMPVVDKWDCRERMLCVRDSFAGLEFLNQSHFRFKMKNNSNYNLIPLFTVLLIIPFFFFFNFVVGGVVWPLHRLHPLHSVLRSLSTTWTGWFKHCSNIKKEPRNLQSCCTCSVHFCWVLFRCLQRNWSTSFSASFLNHAHFPHQTS